MFYKSQQGQGLLEAVMATAIIATGLSGVMALTAGNIKSTGISAEQVIAVNLAREGIEVVHHLRDSNWLANQSFETGLIDTSPTLDDTSILEFNETAGVWSLDWTPVDFDDPKTVMYRNITAGDYEGLYRQDTDSLPGYQATNFKRLIYTYRICFHDEQDFVSTLCGFDPVIGVRVVSEVQWTERGNTRSIMIEDRLFDWK